MSPVSRTLSRLVTTKEPTRKEEMGHFQENKGFKRKSSIKDSVQINVSENQTRNRHSIQDPIDQQILFVYAPALGSYLNFLSDLTFQFIRHKILEHKTPTELFSFCFIFLLSDKFPGMNRSSCIRPVRRYTSSRRIKQVLSQSLQWQVPKVRVSDRILVYLKWLESHSSCW